MFEAEKLGFATTVPSFSSVILSSRKKTWTATVDCNSETSIDRVWWSPGHLSISSNDGRDLTTFDAVPEDVQESQQNKDCLLDVKNSSKRLLQLWYYQQQSVVLLYEDGELAKFYFDPNSYVWNVVGSIVVTSTRGTTVQEACLHAGAIYWIESTGTEDEFNLSYRTLPQDGDDWGLLDFSRQTTLITRLPSSSLFSIATGLLIWPRWVNGPAIFMLWNRRENMLHVLTPDVGIVCSEVMQGPAFNFTKLVLKTMSYWHNITSICNWIAVKPSTSEEQCFIAREGVVKSVSSRVKKIAELDEFDKNVVDCIKYKGCLIVAYASCARVWSLETGKQLQVIYTSESLLGCWIGGVTVHMGGLFWDKGIYLLKGKNMTKETEYPDLLKIKDQEMPSLISLLKEYQSSQHNKNDEHVCKTLLEIHKKLDIPLQQDLEPLINQFQHLMRQDRDSSVAKPENSEGIGALVSTLLDTECPFPSSFICDCLNTVAGCHPMILLQGIDAHLGCGTHNGNTDLTNEEKNSWDFLLNLSKPPLEIFKTICRLKYLKTPNKLKSFVETALQIKEKHFELFIYDNPSYIFGQIGKCLPPPAQSVDYKDAALVLTQLLVKSGDRRALQETLTLLGTEKNWDTVIAIATEMSQGASMKSHYLHLYYAFLAALEKAKVLWRYQEKMLKLAPKKLGISSVLDIIGKFSKKSSTNRLFAQDEELTIKDLQEFLNKNSS